MTGAVFVHGPRLKGWVYLGTGPKTGHPCDKEGRMILVHEYGPPAHDKPPAQAEAVTHVESKPVRRGVAATVQPALL